MDHILRLANRTTSYNNNRNLPQISAAHWKLYNSLVMSIDSKAHGVAEAATGSNQLVKAAQLGREAGITELTGTQRVYVNSVNVQQIIGGPVYLNIWYKFNEPSGTSSIQRDIIVARVELIPGSNSVAVDIPEPPTGWSTVQNVFFYLSTKTSNPAGLYPMDRPSVVRWKGHVFISEMALTPEIMQSYLDLRKNPFNVLNSYSMNDALREVRPSGTYSMRGYSLVDDKFPDFVRAESGRIIIGDRIQRNQPNYERLPSALIHCTPTGQPRQLNLTVALESNDFTAASHYTTHLAIYDANTGLILAEQPTNGGSAVTISAQLEDLDYNLVVGVIGRNSSGTNYPFGDVVINSGSLVKTEEGANFKMVVYPDGRIIDEVTEFSRSATSTRLTDIDMGGNALLNATMSEIVPGSEQLGLGVEGVGVFAAGHELIDVATLNTDIGNGADGKVNIAGDTITGAVTYAEGVVETDQSITHKLYADTRVQDAVDAVTIAQGTLTIMADNVLSCDRTGLLTANQLSYPATADAAGQLLETISVEEFADNYIVQVVDADGDIIPVSVTRAAGVAMVSAKGLDSEQSVTIRIFC